MATRAFSNHILQSLSIIFWWHNSPEHFFVYLLFLKHEALFRKYTAFKSNVIGTGRLIIPLSPHIFLIYLAGVSTELREDDSPHV